jgi:protocatechuate 3,4-dioxygenase beta subunit
MSVSDSSTPATRRAMLKAGAASLAVGAMRLRFPAAAGTQEAASPTSEICVLTPEQTEGPYYLPLELVRYDITEGTPGVPLQLRIAVMDVNDCAPLPDAAVDVWHCDAQGYYSGVNANPGGNANPNAAVASGTFLRGVQVTDADGIAAFQTIYPGWYSGRTVHIHMMVHIGGAAEATPGVGDGGSYTGGHVAHTGQLYFDDAISDEVFATAEAYAGRSNGERVRNEQDMILGSALDEPGFLLALTPLGENPMEDGFLAEITVGIDPSATPGPVGFGGGPPPA